MATETKFTPGPWVAYENAEDKCFYVAQQDGAPYTPDYSDVCGLECRTWSGERPVVQRANAHLIAAAPLMHLSLANRSLLCDDDFEDIIAAIEEGDSEKLRDLWERVQAKARKV